MIGSEEWVVLCARTAPQPGGHPHRAALTNIGMSTSRPIASNGHCGRWTSFDAEWWLLSRRGVATTD